MKNNTRLPMSWLSRAAAALFLGAAFFSPSRAAPDSADSVKVLSFKPPVEVKRVSNPDKWYSVREGTQLGVGDILRTGRSGQANPVSYTHLTLPTSDLV